MLSYREETSSAEIRILAVFDESDECEVVLRFSGVSEVRVDMVDLPLVPFMCGGLSIDRSGVYCAEKWVSVVTRNAAFSLLSELPVSWERV
jgi:hypothetical protein